MSGLFGRSRLTIGASAASAIYQQFDVSSYIPQELQDDFATGQAYYNQFAQAASGVSFGPGGRVTLSPAAQAAVAGAIEGAVIASVPVLGEAFAVLLAVAPQAGGGGGVCASDPPAGPLLDQLEAWPHFQSWESFNGPYPKPSPGSFESFALPVLEYNWLLGANCYSNKAGSSPTILAALIASWNAKHSSSSMRTISRSGLVPSGFTGTPPGYDPIAQALEQAILAKYTPAGPQSFEQATSGEGGYVGPHNVSSSFVVNAGPLIVRPLTLKFGPSSGVALPTTAKLSGPPPAAAARTTTTLVLLGGAAAAAWWFLGLKKPLPKLFR
jgi:hypothetical protein